MATYSLLDFVKLLLSGYETNNGGYGLMRYVSATGLKKWIKNWFQERRPEKQFFVFVFLYFADFSLILLNEADSIQDILFISCRWNKINISQQSSNFSCCEIHGFMIIDFHKVLLWIITHFSTCISFLIHLLFIELFYCHS